MLKSVCLWLGLCSASSIVIQGDTQGVALNGPAYVIDGDTIALADTHIRLQGIDAPELSEPYGHASRRALQTLLAVTPPTCTLSGQHSYGREVGICTINGQDIGELMVKRGYALDCEVYSHGKYKQWEPVNIHLKLTSKPYCNTMR